MSTSVIENSQKSFELNLSKEALFATIGVGRRGKLARSNSPNPIFWYIVVPVDFDRILRVFSFLIGLKMDVLAIRKAKMPEPARINWRKKFGYGTRRMCVFRTNGLGGRGKLARSNLPKYGQLYVEAAIWSSPQLFVRPGKNCVWYFYAAPPTCSC